MSSRRVFDVTGVGLTRDDLPAPVESLRAGGPAGLRRVLGFDPDATRPLDLEIGSGKGTFLVQQAPREPDADFLGVEYAMAFWRYAADRVRRHGLPNVRLLWHDAADFVALACPDACFRRVHVYFPDPWPKARHHKRRLVQAPFLRQLHRVLVPATAPGVGEVRLATDHADYFAWMQEHAAQVADLFDRRPVVRPDSAGDDELIGTNFERKYRKQGRAFHGMTLVRREVPTP